MANPILNLHSNRTDLGQTEARLVTLIQRHAPDAKFVVNGIEVSAAQLIAHLQQHQEQMLTTDEAHRQLHDAVTAEDQMRVTLRDEVTGFKAYVGTTFGASSPQYVDFGFAPKKAAPMTTAMRTAAIEKLRATRMARHTLGKRQRAAIHGSVATAAPSPSPTAAPSPITAPAPTVTPAGGGTNGTS